MHVKYVGPYEAVEIPALHNVEVRRGEQISVDDELGGSLCEQDTWIEVTAAGKPVKRKPETGTTDDTGNSEESD